MIGLGVFAGDVKLWERVYKHGIPKHTLFNHVRLDKVSGVKRGG